jgi:protein involved in temperature-dependent protein secretion
MTKRTLETITNLLATAESTGEALKALRELAEAARHTAALGAKLQDAAATVEDLIDRLAPCVGCTVEDVYAPLVRG